MINVKNANICIYVVVVAEDGETFINVKPSLNCLCGAYEKFFEHCIDRIYLLANIIKNK